MMNLATQRFDDFHTSIDALTSASFSARQSITSAIRASHQERYDQHVPKDVARKQAEEGLMSFKQLKEGFRVNAKWELSSSVLKEADETAVSYKTTGGLFMRFERAEEWILYVGHPDGHFAEDSSLRESLEEEGFNIPQSPKWLRENAEPIKVEPQW
jgi:hypothetical protein